MGKTVGHITACFFVFWCAAIAAAPNDAGFQPSAQTLRVAANADRESDPFGRFTDTLKGLGGTFSQEELLPADEAFRFSAEVENGHVVRVDWQIADGYYLYREKFRFALTDAAGIELGRIDIPHGKPKEDEAFGAVEVFYHQVGFDLPLIRTNTGPARIALEAHFQGCAERGVCYPPMKKRVVLELPAAQASPGIASAGATQPTAAAAMQSEQDRIAAELGNRSLWLTVLSFLGFGVLLAFTPCCFPMIPILSGLIVGHGHRITTGRAFVLSLSYVLGLAATYTVFGLLAGLFGSNLQAVFQEPWVIIVFSLVFVLLSLSMFGLYELQMPAALQYRFSSLSNRQHGGTVIGAAVMGLLSALIVGPCVAAPLTGALIYIGQTGDALLGGLALFAMGFGTGIPLLVVGTSAGKLLPKAGPWMNTTKAVFGVMMLAVAIWMLERILPAAVTMTLWAVLCIISAIYLGATDALPHDASGWRKLWKGVGMVMLTYGVLLLIGVASGSRDVLQPLYRVAGSAADSSESSERVAFQPVRSVAELDRQLEKAGEMNKWVMLDFYADWCISCKEMEYYTFSDPKVSTVLDDMILLQADVTENSAADQALLERFDLIGPPATLFFGPDALERQSFRLVGFVDAESFLGHLQQVTR